MPAGMPALLCRGGCGDRNIAPASPLASHRQMSKLASCALPANAGEAVAAKEIDLSCSQIKQEAFITEALRLQQLRWAAAAVGCRCHFPARSDTC